MSVDRGTSESLAPNGYVYTIYYLGNDAADVPDPIFMNTGTRPGYLRNVGTDQDGLIFSFDKCTTSFDGTKNITEQMMDPLLAGGLRRNGGALRSRALLAASHTKPSIP